MALPAGARLGPYEVAALLGVGGMGEVYRARDTRLNRDVALKVLPELFAADPERLARFKREAQLLASLNHPNIAAIYGIEEGTVVGAGLSRLGSALVLELVEGPTLADRIAQGPIPLDEALPIARQIAEALEAAHQQGVIHRDLKPANIKLRADGTVKVLDFGLAKAFETEAAASSSLSMSPTITSPAATRVGTILGTAAYMSPEQARGRTVDKRSDVWAFGCVLYEMLTGRRPFDGDEVTDVLARVLERDPDWTALAPTAPPAVQRLLRRCLEKDRKRRLPDIGVARIEIDDALTDRPAPVVGLAANRSWASGVLLLAAGLMIGTAAATASMWWLNRPVAEAPVRLSVVHPGPEAIGGTNALDPDVAVSPDGRRIVYVVGDATEARLFVRALDQLEPTELTGLTGPRAPFISPDGNWVGFFDGAGGATMLKKVSINGGPAIVIAAAGGNPRGASWGADDTIVFGTGSEATGLLRVSAAGGMPEVLTRPDVSRGVDHIYPELLPGGRTILYTVVEEGRVEGAQIALLDLATGASRTLISGGSSPHYAASGHIVFAVAGTLRAVPFDLERLEVTGDPAPVASRVVTKGTTGAASFALTQNGVLVYAIGNMRGGAERTLVWVDRSGQEEPIPVPPRAYTYPRLSPDGSRLALDIRDQDNDVWIWDLMRRTLTRLTFDRGFNRGPVWTADGRRLAFSSRGDEGVENLYWQSADGSGAAVPIAPSKEIQSPSSFSSDGRWLFFNHPTNAPYDVGVVDLREGRTEMLLHAAYSETNGILSPDGRWLAYQSNESGRDEIFVRPFPDITSGRWQVSTDGGTRPLWARDGRELFYFLPPGRVMSVPIMTSTASFSAGNPRMLFAGQYVSVNSGRVYDVSPDGRRFVLIKNVMPADTDTDRELVVVQSWFEELARLAPPK